MIADVIGVMIRYASYNYSYLFGYAITHRVIINNNTVKLQLLVIYCREYACSDSLNPVNTFIILLKPKQ